MGNKRERGGEKGSERKGGEERKIEGRGRDGENGEEDDTRERGEDKRRKAGKRYRVVSKGGGGHKTTEHELTFIFVPEYGHSERGFEEFLELGQFGLEGILVRIRNEITARG